MNRQSSSHQAYDIEGLDELQKAYKAVSTEQPDSDIDKQIIAAAQRELASPNPKKSLDTSWWKRMSLPLYVAATFVFTAFASHWLWPSQTAKTLPGTAPSAVTFDLAEPTLQLEQREKSVRPALPKPPVLMAPPELALSKSVSQPPILNGAIIVSENATGSAEDNVTQSVPNEHAAQLSHPEKEIWAREIIELFKQGEYQAGRTELVRFKQIYPDYPIDEQLEILRQ